MVGYLGQIGDGFQAAVHVGEQSFPVAQGKRCQRRCDFGDQFGLRQRLELAAGPVRSANSRAENRPEFLLDRTQADKRAALRVAAAFTVCQKSKPW